MKRLYIVVEGQTEEEFVVSVLRPYFSSKGLYNITPIVIRTSAAGKGGFVKYAHLRNRINDILRSGSQDFIVTTMVDYFRCPELPGEEKWNKIVNHKERVALMERCISDDIQDVRFIPYIQLHEFEALLFSSSSGFTTYFSDKEAKEAISIINEFSNPEDINTSPKGAPSKRLIKIRPKYDKITEGNLIALEVGIENMMTKCRHFKAWIDKLLEVCLC